MSDLPDTIKVHMRSNTVELAEVKEAIELLKAHAAHIKKANAVASATGKATAYFKTFYKRHAPEGAPKFKPELVKATPRMHDGGVEAYYKDKDVSLNMKSYVTWRLGDHDMFTDVSGTIMGKYYTESN